MYVVVSSQQRHAVEFSPPPVGTKLRLKLTFWIFVVPVVRICITNHNRINARDMGF